MTYAPRENPRCGISPGHPSCRGHGGRRTCLKGDLNPLASHPTRIQRECYLQVVIRETNHRGTTIIRAASRDPAQGGEKRKRETRIPSPGLLWLFILLSSSLPRPIARCCWAAFSLCSHRCCCLSSISICCQVSPSPSRSSYPAASI